MSNIMEKMLRVSKDKNVSVLSDSRFFDSRDPVVTELPILNIAFGGSLDGGLVPGVTVFAGPTKSFKTMLSLYCMKAYLDKYPDGIAILYDSEFGITPEYIAAFDIDTSRVLHVPVVDVEGLKFDMVARLNEVSPGDRVFVMVDSIGNLASKKEVDDAVEGKSVADMSRAKAIKSFFRIVTPKLTILEIPCVVIAHTYNTMEIYSKAVVSGGTGIGYSANQIFVITKAQEKDGDNLAGWRFTLMVEKSRFVRERSKLPFTVLYDTGIQRWSSLFDLALESGHVVKSTVGWYNLVDIETGEVLDPKRRAKDIETDDEFFTRLVSDSEFKRFVEEKYKLGAAQ